MKKQKKYIVKEEITLFVALCSYMPEKSRKKIKSLLKNKQVFVNNKIQTKFDFLLNANDIITIRSNQTIKSLPFSIIYEDQHMIVINKPSGLLTISTEKEKQKTAYHFIREYLKQKNEKVFIVHRLDRDTSGILLFAKDENIKQKLQKYWNDITIKRGYLAIVEGTFKPEKGLIRSYLKEEKNTIVHSTSNEQDGKLAITRYRTQNKNDQFSLLEVFLDTGRKNQIRVHMTEAGHPIVGDKKYHSTQNPLHRLGLHAYILELVHPITKELVLFQTPIPKDFENLFKR